MAGEEEDEGVAEDLGGADWGRDLGGIFVLVGGKGVAGGDERD